MREEGLKPPSLKIEGPIELPRLGRAVYVREMGAGDLVEFDGLCWKPNAEGKVEFDIVAYNIGLIVMAACDAEGIRIFTVDDMPAISKWPGRDARLVTRAAARVNPPIETAVEEASKN